MIPEPPLRFRYQTVEFGANTDIHVRTLKDNQQFADPLRRAADLGICSAAWPIFGVLWDAGRVLAGLMHEYPIDGLRILEIGCGIGLASLVLNQREADITATDHHPEAGPFLAYNVDLNEGRAIPFVRTGWADEVTDPGRFDLIVGSDLLYESEHAALLAAFIAQHAAPRCKIILVDPGRGHHARFSRRMIALGFGHSQRRHDQSFEPGKSFSCQVLTYQRQSEPAA